MKHWLTTALLTCLLAGSAWAQQDWQADQDRLKAVHEPPAVEATEDGERTRTGPMAAVLNAALTVYQALFSKQLSTQCIYSLSCSRFSREAIRQHGPIKGFFLSMDRVTRCNGIHYEETSRLRRNAEGKVIDPPEDYTLHY